LHYPPGRAQRDVLQAALPEDQLEEPGGGVPVLQQPRGHPAEQVRAHVVGLLPAAAVQAQGRGLAKVFFFEFSSSNFLLRIFFFEFSSSSFLLLQLIFEAG